MIIEVAQIRPQTAASDDRADWTDDL